MPDLLAPSEIKAAPPVSNSDLLPAFDPFLPDPEASWLRYDCAVEVLLDPGVVLHKPLPDKAGPIPADLSNTGVPATLVKAVDGLEASGIPDTVPLPDEDDGASAGVVKPSKDIIQQRSTPTFTVRLRGYAVRAGHHIPIPALTSFAGMVPTPGLQRIRQRVVANYGGIPVYMAEWILDYILEVQPSNQEIPYPINPELDVSG